MKTMVITPGGAVPLLLGRLEDNINWLSWETPGHGTAAADRAHQRVQHILDLEEAIRNSAQHSRPTVNGEEGICNPVMKFSPYYCHEVPISIIVAVDRDIFTPCTDTVPYPSLKVKYAVCVYSVGTQQWAERVVECTYLVPHLHPSEHNIPPHGGGPLSLDDMIGGILCTHVEGTEPQHVLRELLRSLGHLPHEFIQQP